MDDLDKPNFATQLTDMGVIHKQNVTQVTVRAYWDVLREMSRVDFDRACVELKRTTQWMPKPVEFFRATRKGWM